MIQRVIDLFAMLRVVLYLRMSSGQQNPRSPEQQRQLILTTIEREKLPWQIIGTYTDSALTGKLVKKRPGFQSMLNDIRTERIRPDAILVDHYERFGRADELAHLRNDLYKRHGVLLLTADSRFSDPTTLGGKATAMIEQIRATEDNRIKARNVFRGKKDAVLLRHWPGGPVPLGLRLQTVMTQRNGRTEVDYSIVVPDPETTFIPRHAFQVADELGFGSPRVARALNDDPDIPARFKPFFAGTVHNWLCNELYKGDFRWPKVATDIIDDHRVQEPTPQEEILYIPDFCEGIVPVEQWDRVNAMRLTRSERQRRSKAASQADDPKLINPLIPGVAINYPLAGLVRCGHCRRAMTCGKSAVYTTAAGEQKRYYHYRCTATQSRVCDNHRYIPEEWLRSVVINVLLQRLLPTMDESPNGFASSDS
jgi:DNA invertase Pin-like site-specific DNA recombinase